MLVCSYCSCLHMCMCLKEKVCNNTNVWYHINILVYLFREYPVSSTSGGITNNLLLSNSNNGWFYTLNWLDNPHPNKTKSITWSRHSPCCQKQIHVHGIHHSIEQLLFYWPRRIMFFICQSKSNQIWRITLTSVNQQEIKILINTRRDLTQ